MSDGDRVDERSRRGPTADDALLVRPIGYVRSPFHERVEAPRQARIASDVRGRVELLPGCHYEDALSDLDRWQYIWLLTWFDRNHHWRPKVRPPRSHLKRGVFATRAPHRPNPLGLSAVRLLSVEGLTLHVAELDLLDGTPVLDIKPYVAWADAIANAGAGWLEQACEEDTRPSDPGPRYAVTYAPLATSQITYLRDAHGLDLAPWLETVLSTGPRPHAYRRIRQLAGDHYRLAVKDWRADFRIKEREVLVLRVCSGYRRGEERPESHTSFQARFGDE